MPGMPNMPINLSAGGGGPSTASGWFDGSGGMNSSGWNVAFGGSSDAIGTPSAVAYRPDAYGLPSMAAHGAAGMAAGSLSGGLTMSPAVLAIGALVLLLLLR